MVLRRRRPATSEINPGQLIALGAAIGFSISMILAKSLTRTESALSILFWMIVVQMVVGLLPTLYVWIARDGDPLTNAAFDQARATDAVRE